MSLPSQYTEFYNAWQDWECRERRRSRWRLKKKTLHIRDVQVLDNLIDPSYLETFERVPKAVIPPIAAAPVVAGPQQQAEKDEVEVKGEGKEAGGLYWNEDDDEEEMFGFRLVVSSGEERLSGSVVVGAAGERLPGRVVRGAGKRLPGKTVEETKQLRKLAGQKRKRSSTTDDADAEDEREGKRAAPANDEELARRLHAELNGMRPRRCRRGR